MKILYALPNTLLGGLPMVVWGLAEALAQDGAHCEVAAASGFGGLEMAPLPEVPVHHFPLGPQPRWWPLYSPALSRFLDAEAARFDLIHIQGIGHHGPAAFHAARRHGVPCVVTCHGEFSDWRWQRGSWYRRRVYMRRVWNPIMQSAAAIHCLTEEEQEDITKRVGSPAPLFVVPNGIPAELSSAIADTDPSDFLARYPSLQGKRVILFMARLVPMKGPDILARSFSRIASRFPDAVLLVAGPASEKHRGRMEAVLERAGVRDRVVFSGPLSAHEQRSAYACAELFALPSRFEGFGIVILEAMAAGLPVVISDRCCGTRSLVAEAEAGLVVPPEDEPFAEAMAALLADRPRAARMARNGRRLVEAYTWPAIAKSMAARYSEAVSG